jgi:phage shock protein E
VRQSTKRMVVFLTLIVLAALPATAQYLVVGVEQVRSIITGKKNAILIDVRSPAEYNEGHIPGAINIPAENFTLEKARLPKDKSSAIIFYCRGVG